MSSGLESRFVGLDGLILEANHDLGMLENSPYPDYVRDRIAGPQGHLGNIAAGELLERLAKKGEPLQYIIAAHISENSNTPAHALGALQAGWSSGNGSVDTEFVAASVENSTRFFSLLPKKVIEKDINREKKATINE